MVYFWEIYMVSITAWEKTVRNLGTKKEKNFKSNNTEYSIKKDFEKGEKKMFLIIQCENNSIQLV